MTDAFARQESMYEYLHGPLTSFVPLSEVPKTRFFDSFGGDQIANLWTQSNNGGNVAMSPDVNGGILLTSGATTGTWGGIKHGDKRKFAQPCRIIWVVKKNSIRDNRTWMLLSNRLVGSNYFGGQLNHVGDNMRWVTNDGAFGFTAGSPQDLNYHKYDSLLTSSKMDGRKDNVLEATRTTQLTGLNMQPAIRCDDSTNPGVQTSNALYCEAINL